jgi:hypothetical protein
VFNDSEKVYYNVASTYERRRTRDRHRDWALRCGGRDIYARTIVGHAIPADASDETQVGRFRKEAYKDEIDNEMSQTQYEQRADIDL